MEIFNSQGKNLTKSGVQVLNKAIGSLIVSMSIDFEELTTEQISIEVEKLTGNEEITKGYMSLADFILMTTFKGDAITSDAIYKTTAQCEICENGSIELGEKDVIKIELIGLKSANTYVVNGIEEPQTSHKTLSFENKSMSSDDKSKTFDVAFAELAILDNNDSILEVAYSFENGVVVKYTLHELRVLSRSIDPLAYVRQDGSVKCAFAGKLQIPLFGVNSIEVRKTQGSIVNLIVRREA